MKVKSLSCVLLFVTLWTVAFQIFPYMGFSRQEYWCGWPFPSPGDLPDPGIEPGSPTLQADTLPSGPPGKHLSSGLKGNCECTKINYCSVAKLCPTLCHPMDCSLPSFFIHGISQARILEWVLISFSKINLWYWYFSRSEWYSD